MCVCVTVLCVRVVCELRIGGARSSLRRLYGLLYYIVYCIVGLRMLHHTLRYCEDALDSLPLASARVRAGVRAGVRTQRREDARGATTRVSSSGLCSETNSI